MSEIDAMESQDYREYYGLEKHLFDTIHHRFHRDGQLSAFDFFCIVIWKANRAKSKVATNLLKHQSRDLESAVSQLTRGNRESGFTKGAIAIHDDMGTASPYGIRRPHCVLP